MDQDLERLNMMFDEFLTMMELGLTHEDHKAGKRMSVDSFEQFREWKGRNGWHFNIYGNDHLIDGKKHFHFDHKEKKVFAKVDFDGNVLELKNQNDVPSRILKDLRYFLSGYNRTKMEEIWDRLNPA